VADFNMGVENMEKMIVIGGNAAGMSAAAKARRGDATLSITVFEQSSFVSYGSCGLPYYISDEIKEYSDLVAFTPDFFMQERNIDVKIEHQVTEINLKDKFVLVKDLRTGQELKYNYTKLVIATGASPIIPPIKGIDFKNIFTLRNVEDGVKIKQVLENEKINKVAILGAGFIGLEMAEAFSKRNIEASIFEMLPQILPQIDPDLSAIIEVELNKNGVKLYKNTEVIEFEAAEDGKVKSLRVGDNRVYDVDMVLVSLGYLGELF
jgi:NADPH-dependent 2,4-dienoyl-CoA reductase/sulfur reductase-like enzyme